MRSKETKTLGFQDEAKQNEKKKRSQRNIALEDREEELKRNKDSTNMSYDEDDNDPKFSIEKTRFVCNTQPHLQIIPSIQLRQDRHYYPYSGSTSQTNVSYAMPEKYILEFVLDILQRSDPDELFSKPINPNGVNKPLDFATIRAKINMEHYMSIDAFKFDVYRLCFSAMYYNDKDSRHYQVAKVLHGLAMRVFEDINVVCLQQFHLESFPKNTPLGAPNGIPQVGKQKTIGHARFRHIIPSKSLLNYQDKRESNNNGGGRKHNFSVTIPQFLDKNVDNCSENIGVGACSSQMGVWPSQDSNYARRDNNANNSFSSQPNQYGHFQGLVSPSAIYLDQNNDNELFQAKQCFSTFPINSYSELQMILGQEYPMGPFPMLQHSILTSSPIPQVYFPSSSNVMRENLNQTEVEKKNKEKDREGTSTNDGENEEVDLDLKL